MRVKLGTKFPLVSIIIVNYNGEEYLESCINSVLSAEYPNFEVILFDNASTDNSLVLIEQLLEHEPRLVIVRNPKNLGFAEGNNIGITASKGKYVVFLNNDTQVTPNWLNELVEVLEEDPLIGAGQSKLLQINDIGYIDSVGDFIDYFGATFCRGNKERDSGQYHNIEEIFSARGAAMILRRDVISEVGAFDPLFFIRCEDIDICWRIRLRGYKVVLVPSSVVYHAGGSATSEMQSSKVLFHGVKNVIMMLLKNYSFTNLVKYNPLLTASGSVFLDLIARKNIPYAFTRLEAVFWVLKNLKHVWRNRQIVQERIRKVSDSEPMKHMARTNYAQYFKLFFSRIKQQ